MWVVVIRSIAPNSSSVAYLGLLAMDILYSGFRSLYSVYSLVYIRNLNPYTVCTVWMDFFCFTFTFIAKMYYARLCHCNFVVTFYICILFNFTMHTVYHGCTFEFSKCNIDVVEVIPHMSTDTDTDMQYWYYCIFLTSVLRYIFWQNSMIGCLM